MEKLVENAVMKLLRTSGGKVDKVGGRTRFKQTLTDTPWIYIKYLDQSNCYLWAGVAQHIKKKFIHSGCQSCYKVVLKPENYYDLLMLDEVMHGMGLPSKLGIERRPYVKGLYGAYFYTRSLEEARALKDKYFKDVATIKRGCTELERKYGRSDKWEVYDFQLKLEHYLDTMVFSHRQPEQTDEEKNKIREKWRRWAWKFDPAYNGKEVYQATVAY